MTVRAYLIVYYLIQSLTISLYIKGMASLLRPVFGLHIAVLATVSGRIFCGMEFSSTDFTYFLKTHLYLLAVPFIMPFLTPFLCHGVPPRATKWLTLGQYLDKKIWPESQTVEIRFKIYQKKSPYLHLVAKRGTKKRVT